MPFPALVRRPAPDVLDPRVKAQVTTNPRLRNQYLDQAGSYLAAGWDYANALPGGGWRIKLATAWPALRRHGLTRLTLFFPPARLGAREGRQQAEHAGQPQANGGVGLVLGFHGGSHFMG